MNCPILWSPSERQGTHGCLILEWVTFPFFRGSSQPRDQTQVSRVAGGLYQLRHKGSPRILEWVAYPFSSRCSQPRNSTGVFCIAGGFFTNWAMREAVIRWVSLHHNKMIQGQRQRVMKATTKKWQIVWKLPTKCKGWFLLESVGWCIKSIERRKSLAVQWLGLALSLAKGLGFNPWLGNRDPASHMSCSQKNKTNQKQLLKVTACQPRIL